MTGDTTIGTSTLGGVAGAPDTRESGEALQQRVRLMAQQFEAMLMTQMLREMRQSMLSDDDDENGLGKDTMIDSLDVELGGVLSRAGGFGLASMLSKAIEQRTGVSPLAPPAAPFLNGLAPLHGLAPLDGVAPLKQPFAGAAPDAVEPAPAAGSESTAPEPGNLRVPQGRVSSVFGWRPDPFNGVSKFHSGIDVAQAYGQDVRAAAGGRVAFSGDKGSYGTTVVVEHAGGRQTLYGHLSALDVRVGDVVDSGQVIGKSGSSGRSTGPHLHFEVLSSGHPVDPSGPEQTGSRIGTKG